MNCLICNQKTKYLFTIANYPVVECLNCGHRMTKVKNVASHIERTYSDNYFFDGGAGYPNYLDEETILTQYGRRYGEILAKYIKNNGKVLDVGAAAGFILKGLVDAGWEGYGVEPNECMAQYAKNKLRLNVQTCPIESYHSSVKFDLICLIQVIAHLVDPLKIIRHLDGILAENGFILVETWNTKSITARIFGKKWHEYSPPSVLHWFCNDSLNYLFEKCNFQRHASGRPSKKLNWKHAQSLLLFKLNKMPFSSQIEKILNIIPDHTLIPYPAEDLKWILYRKRGASCI